jgi:phage recombination protein Bet
MSEPTDPKAYYPVPEQKREEPKNLQKINQSSTGMLAKLSSEQLALLKSQACPKASDLELEYFLSVSQKTGLDWVTRQIYGIMRKQQGVEKLTIQIGIDGYRLIAERSGKYEGQTAPLFSYDGMDGWQEVPMHSLKPVACKVGVYKKGQREPVYSVVLFSEREQQFNPLWKSMPHTMLAKCAEVDALRKAFPNETNVDAEELDAQVYQENTEQKRLLIGLIKQTRPDFDLKNTLALRELSSSLVGCPLNEIQERVKEFLNPEF